MCPGYAQITKGLIIAESKPQWPYGRCDGELDRSKSGKMKRDRGGHHWTKLWHVLNTYCLISYWKSWVILNKGRRLSHLLPGSDLQQHVKEKEAREEVLRLEVGIKVWSDHRGFMQQVRGSLILSLTWVCNNGTLPHFSLWRTSLQLVAVKTQVGHLSTQSSHSVLDLCVWLLFQSSWFKKKRKKEIQHLLDLYLTKIKYTSTLLPCADSKGDAFC